MENCKRIILLCGNCFSLEASRETMMKRHGGDAVLAVEGGSFWFLASDQADRYDAIATLNKNQGGDCELLPIDKTTCVHGRSRKTTDNKPTSGELVLYIREVQTRVLDFARVLAGIGRSEEAILPVILDERIHRLAVPLDP